MAGETLAAQNGVEDLKEEGVVKRHRQLYVTEVAWALHPALVACNTPGLLLAKEDACDDTIPGSIVCGSHSGIV